MTSPICPECREGKHRNCNEIAWDFDLDQICPCECDSKEDH